MTTRPFTAAMRLYPAAYRAERGPELSTVYADTTAGAGRLAAARELAGIAGYGLRLRTGLTSAAPGGRLLAAAAPLVLAAGAGTVLPDLLMLALENRWGAPVPGADRWLFLLVAVGQLAAAAAGLAGRWAAARLLVLPVVLGVAGLACLRIGHVMSPASPRFGVATVVWLGSALLPPLIWSALVLAAPPDLLPRPSVRRVLGAAVLAAASLELYSEFSPLLHSGSEVFLLPPLLSAALIALGLAAASRGRVLPVAVVLALVPAMAGETLGQLYVVFGYLRSSELVLVAAGGLAASIALLVRRDRSAELPPAVG
ncbi:hypothetical protein [Kitasatospora sp. DSM 101779]|uniref:hypothetical protein n=1 Tax=Kitasatospora sp. DSM 101779 TaxID=2853165 RepID=UPI0021D84238|nr:hypothetical protein [Kitasatospora sp. DSM 101779]MCU7823343.1 hypothetical protein [Kitasatospora sp. DSM 101779]